MLTLYDVVVSITLLLFRHIHNFPLSATVAQSTVIDPFCLCVCVCVSKIG